MKVSWFSIFMAIVSSSLLMLIVFLFRKRIGLINKFGIPTLIIMLGFCFFRMVFLVEFPNHQYIIDDPYVLSRILNPFLRDHFELSTKIMVSSWIAVMAVLLIQLGVSQYLSHKRICSLNNTADDKIFEKLVEIDEEKKLTVIRSDKIPIPMLAGIFNPVILLPEIEYTDDEIDAVIRHEYTHWKNKDNVYKFVVHIFWRIFWWNPFSYLFLINLSKILELKCDRQVTLNMNNAEKFDYLQSMLDVIRKTGLSDKRHFGLITSCYVQERNKFDINQRFDYVLLKAESKRSQTILRVLVIVLMVFIVYISYYVIIQPQYEPLSSEVDTGSNVYELDSSVGHIVKEGDGYRVILPDGSSYELKDEDSVKQMVDSGFVLIKEE